jgi:hypothetical protein
MVVSNTLRNAALNLGTPSPHLNKAFALSILKVHEWMNLDANDPRTTAEGEFRIKTPSTHETVAGNPLLTFVIVLIASYLILSAIFQWKVTGSRYQLPFFALAGALVGYVVPQSINQRAGVMVSAALLLGSVPWLIGNQTRPLINGARNASVNSILVEPREHLYFSNGPYLEIPYREMTALRSLPVHPPKNTSLRNSLHARLYVKIAQPNGVKFAGFRWNTNVDRIGCS